MRKLGIKWAVAAVACYGWVTLGCTPPASAPAVKTNAPPMAAEDLPHVHDEEHEHGDHVHASTYAAAIAQIDSLRSEIKAAFEKGDGNAADGSVHALGHALEDVNTLAKEASLNAADQAAVGVAVETLLDAFDRVDQKIHGHDGAVYNDVATEVDAAMATLKKFVAPKP